MSKRLARVAALALCAFGAGQAFSEEKPASLYGDPAAPNISGQWMGTAMGIPGEGPVSNSGKTADGRPPVYWSPWPLPYTPEYQKIYDERVAATKKGRALGDIGARCLPFGLPTTLASQHYPEEIVQTPGQVTFYFFATFPVTIWTDGRPHPTDLKPSYNGHSIGHWEGDTLFVDTVGINGSTPLDSNRDPHGPDLHMKWTVRHVAPDILHITITLYDEKAFTEPVTMTNITHRKNGKEWEVLDDQSCFENNEAVPVSDKAQGFIKF